jgi:RND family efflux transporter MFP subunit
LAILGASLIVLVAMGGNKTPDTKPPAAPHQPAVEVAVVQQHDRGIDFDVDGVAIPFQQIEVPAEVAGRVAFRSENCRIGHSVRRGDVLLKVDPQDYDLEVRRMDEMVKQAQAELGELQVEVEAARRQVELAKEDLAIKQREVRRYLAIEDPGVYTEAELDSVRLKELQARDALQTEIDQGTILEARRERLTSARELAARQLEKARLDLSRTEIVAPIDGVITREPVEQGSYIQRGGVAVVIQDTSCMEIRCKLHMKEMHWLWQSASAEPGLETNGRAFRFPKTPVTVTYDMDSVQFHWDGTLQYYDGVKIDEQTRMIPCRVRVAEPSKMRAGTPSPSGATPPSLMAGMFVTVQVHSKPQIPLLRLPEAAVQPGGTVWTVREEQLHEVPLRVAHATSKLVIAYDDEEGLKAGDLVVVSPLAAPTEGASVSIMGER